MGIDDGVSHLEEQSREAVPVPSDPEVTHSAFVAEQSVEFIEDHADGGPFLCVAGFCLPGRRRPGPPDQALLSVPRSRAVAVRRFFTTAPDLPEMFPEEPRSGRPRTGAER
jgi:hypothetical protein